ncbi:hypothetical protein KCMC57_up01900 [Kitasatospora sp. CMC57]|uniref:Uncharacterized protein n=1 Tax=Kitasatospora sp. CMC57 TaxID=3231513 RepID=A0AB33JR92_9ACTN
MYVLGAAWAIPAPSAPLAMAAAATRVAPARKLRLLNELVMDTSLALEGEWGSAGVRASGPAGDGRRLLRMKVRHVAMGCQRVSGDRNGLLVEWFAYFRDGLS